jgi:hypothetical protein
MLRVHIELSEGIKAVTKQNPNPNNQAKFLNIVLLYTTQST